MADRKHLGALTVGWRFLWRQLRSVPSIGITIFAAVLLAAIFLATTPRAIERISNQALHDALTSSSLQQRNIAVDSATRIPATTLGDPFTRVKDAGERFAESEFSESVRSIISEQTYVVDSGQFGVFPMPGRGNRLQGRSESRGSASVCAVCSDYLPDEGPYPSFVRLRYQDQIEDKATLIEGSMPSPRDPLPMLIGAECPEDAGQHEKFEESHEIECRLEDVPVFEVAMTAETLSVLSFGLGDMVVLKPDLDDTLFSQAGTADLDYQLVLAVSGVIELPNSEEEYWYGDPRLHRASITENPDVRILFATGLISPDDYFRLLRSLSPARWQYSWRYFIDHDLVEAGAVEELAADLHNLELDFPNLGSRSDDYSAFSSLPTLIGDYTAQRSLTAGLMSMALFGVLAIAIALTIELGVLVAIRQRHSIVLARNRGASSGQLTLTRIYQGLLMTVPAVAFGYLISGWLLPETDYLLPYRATVALALGTTAAFVLVSVPLIYGALGSLQTEETAPTKSPGLRLVLELLVMVVAAASIILLRRRAQIDVSTADSQIDPLLAAAPALLGVAVGLVTVRVYPYLIRGAAFLASGSRSVVAFVGFRRILQQSPGVRASLVVILLAVSVAVFSIVVRTSISQGQEDSALQAAAADYSVTGRGPGIPLLTKVDVSSIDAVEMTASASRYPDALAVLADSSGFVEFLAIDSDAYDSVIAGKTRDRDLVGAIRDDHLPNAGALDSPIPVIVSNRGWRSVDAPDLGDRFRLEFDNVKPQVVVVEVRDRFPGLPLNRPFVVADVTSIDNLKPPFGAKRTILYIRAPESAGAEIQSTVTAQSSGTRFASRYETLRDVADSPLGQAVDRGLVTTFGLSVVFAIVAAVSSLALSSRVRRRDLGYLRTLGLRTRQATGLTVIEQLPIVVVAAAVGSLVGIATVLVLQPSMDLAAFTGGLFRTSLEYDWSTIAAVSVFLVAALAISVVISVLVNRSEDLGTLLKVGDE